MSSPNFSRKHLLWLAVPLALMFGGYKAHQALTIRPLLRPMLSMLSLGTGIQTYTYTGSPFNIPDCHAQGYTTECVKGGFNNISVTFGGMAAGYTGTLHNANIVAWSARADQIGVSLNSSSDLFNIDSTFTFFQGQVTAWSFSVINSSGRNFISSQGPAGPIDLAHEFNGTSTEVGYNTTSPGTWTNSTILGPPCYKPGGVSCGNPIDIGTGNKYEQVTDYTTAGQNPLAFTRYYNSMAAPDTYAASLGQNWRTNYDRYLHIINPSAIYGVEAERPDGGSYQLSVPVPAPTRPDSDVD